MELEERKREKQTRDFKLLQVLETYCYKQQLLLHIHHIHFVGNESKGETEERAVNVLILPFTSI